MLCGKIKNSSWLVTAPESICGVSAKPLSNKNSLGSAILRRYAKWCKSVPCASKISVFALSFTEYQTEPTLYYMNNKAW